MTIPSGILVSASYIQSLRVLEAGGVGPLGEKRYATEPACLSQFPLVGHIVV